MPTHSTHFARITGRLSLASVAASLALATLLSGCNSLSLTNPFAKKAPTPAIDAAATKITTGKIPGNNSIPVVVNDQPITNYDIDQRLKLMQISGATGTQQSATQDLIDETLETQEAQRVGLTVGQDQVDAAYASIAQNLQLSPSGLTSGLNGEGIDANTLKRRLLAQIIWQQLVVGKAQQAGTIKESDITSALLAKGDPNGLTTKEYTLQDIIFVVPSGSTGSAYDQRNREAEAFRQRFQGCDKSLDQAKQLTGVVVKDIGRRESTDLTGASGDEIKNTKAGSTTRPQQTAQGIEVIAVCAVKDVQSTAEARANVENDLFAKQSDAIATSYLNTLRSQATIVYR